MQEIGRRDLLNYRVYTTKKLSNKATLLLRLLSKCSFTPSKLRFFELRKPKISPCYTTSRKMGLSNLLLDSPFCH